jgi:flagellar protein FlaG
MDIQPIAHLLAQIDSVSARGAPSGDASATVAVSAPVETQTAAAVKAVPTASQISQALQDINKTLQMHSVGVEFSQDTDSHQTIIKVVDTQTQDVIRQIPSETMLEIAKALDKVQGMLVDAKA